MIRGLDKLNRELKEAQKALEGLDGNLGTVNFDPDDPASIELAITEMERMIADKVGRYASNPFVGPLVKATKQNFRKRILERAAQARLGEGEE